MPTLWPNVDAYNLAHGKSPPSSESPLVRERRAGNRRHILRQMESDLIQWEQSAFSREYSKIVGFDPFDPSGHVPRFLVHVPALHLPGGTFVLTDIDTPGAVPTAVIPGMADDRATLDNFWGWPMGCPNKFATALPAEKALGCWQIFDPPTYLNGETLAVWRTPELWLRARCRGVVVMNYEYARFWLEDRTSWQAQNAEHADEIDLILRRHRADRMTE